MSLTAGLWVATAVSLVVLAIKRPVWALAFYMLTFFAAPNLWWWGDELPDLRYALFAGFLLLGAVIIHWSQPTEGSNQPATYVTSAALGMAINATCVHFLFAVSPSVSTRDYVELLKFILLFFLIGFSVKDRRDFRIVAISIALGAAYIGYEVTINERGDFNGARLEGVGAPGADGANSLASLLLVALPIAGSLLLGGARWHKAVVAIAAPLILNVILLCNSRGAFLALIAMGAVFLVLARGVTRRIAIRSLALAGVILYMLLGDPEILERFLTTFVGSEERDSSAASRIEFWKAGLVMLQDYPLGAGGGAFKYVLGDYYLQQVSDYDAARSLHNGYLTIATSWGVQGLLLYGVFVAGAVFAAYRTMELCRRTGDTAASVTGLCLLASITGLLVASIFGSFLSNEWGYWVMALLCRYSMIHRTAAPVMPDVTATAADRPVGSIDGRERVAV